MSSPQEFNCIFCKETFSNKEDLQIHFRKHGDPRFNQNQRSKTRPQNEAQSSAEKKSEEAEMVSCDVCSEMFPTISKAITHKHKVHPDHDAKYFCPWCGKLFTMKHLYNKHLQSNHINLEKSDTTNFHCDACDVDFFVPSAMLYHNKFFHRQDTDLPTIGQSKKLKMCQQEVLQIYYCAFCGDEYDNKVNLHKHMADDHGDENQSPEDVLRCPLCEAIFYHLDAYEVHLTFHSTDDLYSEKNEMFEQIDEFSLETVPPVVEKVENVAQQEDVETEINAIGIDKFLEMAMDETLEKDSDSLKSKSKKHKKHKRKKKEAITLDEFLSMNKDVFGEGLDVQGVEEVPTQVVAKRLKQKKTMKPAMGNLKVAQSSELEKLKKQGIVIKMKPTRKPSMQNLKIANKILTKPIPSVNKLSSNIQCTPDEVLSKLINQSNSQIKIVKKNSQENPEATHSEGLIAPSDENKLLDKEDISPENIEVECDVNMPSEYTSSENESKEENGKNDDRPDFKTDSLIISKSNSNADQDNKHVNSEFSEEVEKSQNVQNLTTQIEDSKIKDENIEDKTIRKINQISPLINSNITIKSVSQNASPSLIVKTTNSKNIAEEKSKANEHEENKPEKSSNNSLNALKHLSHLITVKSVTPKRSSTPVPPIEQVEIGQNVQKITKSPEPKDAFLQDSRLTQTQADNEVHEEEKAIASPKENPPSQVQVTKEKSLSSLRNLSKNLTIKSVTQSPKNASENTDDNDDEDENNTVDIKDVENSMNQAVIKLSTLAKNPDINIYSPKGQSNPRIIKPNANSKDALLVPDKQSNISILKHLTNVTAKPVISTKNNVQQVVHNTENKPIIPKPNVTTSSIKKQDINEEIEIFNIDDSDDEPSTEAPPVIKSNSPKPNPPKNICHKSMDTFKNISKHIIVKPVNQQATSTHHKANVKQADQDVTGGNNQCSMSDFSDDDDQNTLIPTNFNIVKQKLKLQNDHLKNTLKNLGKHITVKSGNPSPNSFVQSGKDFNAADGFELNEGADSDDSCSGKVKITEVTDDNGISDDDMAEQCNKIDKEYDGNISVKSPGESNSDHDNFDEAEDDLSDLEYQIKVNTLKKPSQQINRIMNLQNLNKNITIKSLADKKTQGSREVGCNRESPNINSKLSIKPFKQIKPENPGGEDYTNKKNIMNAAQVKRSIINQNQSVASTSQHNTVNKEVTVKTFQTKTVIQEITTTVTKTIKTVNQTLKQEEQSTSQNNLMKFQKVQGMKTSNQQIKNFQGVTVRHATPVAGTKIRAGAPPNIGNNIRTSNQLGPCNQLVPVRPARNIARMSVPRMSAVKRNAAPGGINQLRPTIGRPLKISPNAVSTTKRPTDEPGHFSCFKKPKESLIPVSEVPSFEQGGESVVQFSSSQVSKSNVTSATRTVRGNTVVTQMKSEVSASSQQLEKLNSVSGLKVVKTSQSKQAMKVEERCEMSPSKRNTLEAIEKLQKQGLLVKKPRLEDVGNDSDHSEDGEEYITEEPDE